ncbi:MAG: glycoside hydrolase family 3 C-terminal domain-containing protein [Bacteroidetes bacterium]|nr:glycoside hydrolase family 3 C-terminal domain-containing protein [Bacteroidota bacterium]
MKQILLFFLFIFLSVSSLISQESSYRFPFQDPALGMEKRISDLISRLSLEEKASMMLYNSPGVERLGIPPYNWWNECLHGVARAGKATVFPQAIGMAATFDPDLVYRIAGAISDEARAKHNAAVAKGSYEQYTGLTFWTPNVNIFRDPRWGRGQETYGEDPYLTSRIGEAFVGGLQGDDRRYLKAAACAKHYVVHSGPEESRHHFDATPPERDFFETYLPAFKALADTGVEAVMCAYNRTYGLPCCGSPLLLQKVLREYLGFEGHIVSDCWALDDIWARHKVVDTRAEAAAMAANAGVNLNCGYIYKYLPEAVDSGLVLESTIDSNLAVLLRTRFRLGLMDPPEMVPFNAIPREVVNCDEHREMALEAATKSIVLLKNENNTLPLDESKIRNIFITGPTAFDNDALVGNYNGFSGNMVTFVEGIVNRSDPGTVVDYSRGCLLNTDSIFHGFWEARRADVSIAVVGLNRMLEGEEGDAMLAEGGDRQDIRLPRNQVEFLHKLRHNIKEKPLIVVITGGSAIATEEIDSLADAMLFAWYPGEQGGNALADILFGSSNPSGRLPVTFYRNIEDLPPYDDYSMEGRTYRYFSGKVSFPFGHGLSYSDFAYENPRVAEGLIVAGNDIRLSLTISNNSDTPGDEVVQVYAARKKSGNFRPRKTLIAFQRVSLDANEKKHINFVINSYRLSYFNEYSKRYRIDPGLYELQIGASSEDIRARGEVIIFD